MTHSINLPAMLSTLQNADCFDHPVGEFTLMETHISYVLLTGSFAYKFKKNIDLGFLDFSTLEKRKFYLDEEYRLNKRLASDLYLGVLAISGSETNPSFTDQNNSIIEYALKMVQFPVENQLDNLLDKNRLMPEHIDDLAKEMATFHTSLEPARMNTNYGDIDQICYLIMDNFNQINPETGEEDLQSMLTHLKDWNTQKLDQLEQNFRQRKHQGFIRECHGDMHLSNMVLINNKVVIFDCIEFNQTFRWIDVISEIAFAMMDLGFRKRHDLANRLINNYLEQTGDYAGLQLLNFYRIYRSMVRAKVADIQRRQTRDPTSRKQLTQKLYDHVSLADDYRQKKQPVFLCITHGFSGSGKTTYTEQLVDLSGAIRLRSDIERKRLFDLKAETIAGDKIGKGLYKEDINKNTYDQLERLSRLTISAGYPVIVDATFIDRDKRDQFKKLSEELSIPFHILDFTASTSTLEKRITKRNSIGKDSSDADLAVLKHQLENNDHICEEEKQNTLIIDTEKSFNPAEAMAQFQTVFF